MYQEESQKKYEINSSDDEGQVDLQKVQSKVSSQQKSQKSVYDEILDVNIINPRTKEEMISVLNKNGIIYKEERWLDGVTPYQLLICKINHTKNYEIVTLTILIGPFEQEVTILNVFKESFINRLEPLFFQGHTNIYLLHYKEKEFICKATSYSDNQKIYLDIRKEEIIQSLREYCVSNIMSALKIGPKLQKNFDFDLIISDSGIQFYLEYCRNHGERVFTEHDEITLKNNLKEMHLLGFLHRDIKPANIMYSKAYDKFVFIDFGISEFRRQKPGELIKSKFLGTYAYCTEEFKKLFNSRQSDWVDPYVNDAWGLKLSTFEMQKSYDSQKILINTFSNTVNQIVFNPELLEREVKRMIFNNEIEKISSIVLMKRMDQKFQRRILNFFYEVPATESLRRFYLIDISDDIKMDKMFEELWECFKTPVFIESYKGTRTFLTVSEEKSNIRFKEIYSKIQDKYSNISKNQIIYKRQAENILTVDDPINQLELRQHQKKLIEYISFTNLKYQATMKEKLIACKKYAIRAKLQLDFDFLESREIIQEVMYEISLSFIMQDEIENWNIVLKAVENYFIVVKKADFDITEYLSKFVNRVQVDYGVSNIKKIQIMFQLLISRRFITRRHRCVISFLKSSALEKLVEENIKRILNEQKQKTQSDISIFQFLLQAYKLYNYESNREKYFDDSQEITKQMKHMRAKYPELQKLFNQIEFEVGIHLQKNDQIIEGRKLQEEKSYQSMIQQNELSINCVELINLYDSTMEIKKIKTYMQILDQAINCKEISDEFFIRTRILIELYLNNYPRARELLRKYEVFMAKSMNFFICLNNAKWIIRVVSLLRISYLQIPPEFYKFCKNSQRNFFQQMTKYFQSNQPLVYCNSRYWFHTQMLYYFSRVEAAIKKEFQIAQPQICEITSENWIKQSWKKLISKERSDFVVLDHMFMISYDIQILRREKRYDQMVKYIKDRLHIMEEIPFKTNRAQKSKFTQNLSLIVESLGYSSNHSELLEQFMQILIPIFKHPKMGYLFIIEDNKFNIVKGLIITGNFSFLMECLIQSTKLHSRHICNSNISIISMYYSQIAAHVLRYYKEKEMVCEIRKVLQIMSPKQHSIFSIFLLFFIYPCNRRRIVKYLYQSLDYINHTGKQIILSRLYKEQMKYKHISKWRKKYLTKKDLICPERCKLNVQDMKAKLNFYGQMNRFHGRFLETLEGKLIKLGKNCQIYSEERQQHPLNRIFNFEELDLQIREYQFQKWQKQIW